MTKHFISSASILFVLVSSSVAQVSQSNANGANELKDNQIHEISISPETPGRPALKYRLFPDKRLMVDRNAALYYHRAIAALRSRLSSMRVADARHPDQLNTSLFDDPEKFQSALRDDLKKMPVEEMRQFMKSFDDVFIEIDRACYSSQCDFGIQPSKNDSENWFEVKMEEVQFLRSICYLLAFEIRINLYDRNFDLAVERLQYGYKIANDLKHSNSIVGGLVGIACANIMNEQLLTWIQQPDAPNMYWPITDLPTPLVDIREVVRSEIAMISGQGLWQILQDPENANLSTAGWLKTLEHDIESVSNYIGLPKDQAQLKLLMNTMLVRGYPVAKQSLIDSGHPSEYIEKLPAIQVVAIHQKQVIESACDEILKSLNLPYGKVREFIEQTEEAMHTVSNGPMAGTIPYLEFFLPVVSQVIHAEARTQRQLAGLRTIEAIRAHAAATGELPTSIEEIGVVPLPINPATARPFVFERQSIKKGELQDFGFMQFSWRLYKIKLGQ